MLPKERLQLKANERLKEFISETAPMRPRCIILFGSYARGDFTEESDIDVCVIADNLPKDELARRTLSGQYNTKGIRAIGFFPDEFLNYLRTLKFLVYDIVADGKVILDNTFHKVIKENYETYVRKYGITRTPKGWKIALYNNRPNNPGSNL